MNKHFVRPLLTIIGQVKAWKARAVRYCRVLPGRPMYDYGEYWRPSTEDAAKAMIIEPYPSDEAFEASGRWDAGRIRKLVPDTQSVLLDFGCGIGRVMKYLTAYRTVYGIDVSEKMLRFARRRVPEDHMVFLRIQGLTLPIPDNSVDFVYSLLTLQHIDRRDVKRLILEFRRVLKPWGKALLQFPEYGDGEMGRDTRRYTVEQVRTLMKDFTILSLERVSGDQMPVETKMPLWVNINVLVQRS